MANKRNTPEPLRELKRDPRRLFSRDTHPELPLDPDVEQLGIYKWPPHFTPSLLLIVFIGGCVGAFSRYWVIQQFAPDNFSFPAATFLVNLLGAFLLGLLLEGLARLGADDGLRRVARLGVGTGFIGAFTTYSTFAIESEQFLKSEHFMMALLYITSSLIGGVAFAGLGIKVAAEHHKRREGSQ